MKQIKELTSIQMKNNQMVVHQYMLYLINTKKNKQVHFQILI